MQLSTQALRALTVDPRRHPRGQPFLSAASGLVCAHGRAYVVADDELHLGVFHSTTGPGELHRVLPGKLPGSKAARKKRKPDLETLFMLPTSGALVALGSGSRPNRGTGVVITLDAAGEPAEPVQGFDLEPLYAPLRERLGEINIEGAMVIGDELVLLHRAIAGQSDNTVLRYRLGDLRAVIAGQAEPVAPRSQRGYALGRLQGVALGFTDAAPLPDGGWVFTAVAEATDDAYNDGACHGAAVGVVSAGGDLLALHPLAQPLKVEGIAARVDASGLHLCLVTDPDDPARSSRMVLAHL